MTQDENLALLNVVELRKTHFVRRVATDYERMKTEKMFFNEWRDKGTEPRLIANHSNLDTRFSGWRKEATIGGLTVTLMVLQGWGEPVTYMAVTKKNGKKKYDALRNFFLEGARPDDCGWTD